MYEYIYCVPFLSPLHNSTKMLLLIKATLISKLYHKRKKIWQRNYFWCKLHLKYPIHKLVRIFLKTYSISIRWVRCMLKSANIPPFYGSDTLNVLHLHKADIWILKNWILWNGRWFNCKKLIWIMLIYDPPSQVYMAI